ncbi:MAG: hypothetical protein SPI77_03020 [Corynebacterium sp.]|nr:hypothetical protein [Corynebacterium sp.]
MNHLRSLAVSPLTLVLSFFLPTPANAIIAGDIAQLGTVAEELNDRPRKTLNWEKPSEKILELINT